MKIEYLKEERIKDFTDYCRKYRDQIDESFLYEEDLEDFKPDEENPTYVLLNDGDEIIGAASLIIDAYHKRGKKGRFRIFHAALPVKEAYGMMLSSILKHTDGLDKIIVFMPEENKVMTNMLELVDFNIERYSYVLERDELEVPEAVFPEEFELKTYEPGRDEEAWCEVRNAAFAKLAGNETPIIPEQVREMAKEKDFIEGGMMLLYHKDKPAGVIRAIKEVERGEAYTFIAPIAIKPEYQGRGLGRNLLRAALRFGQSVGMPKAMLCVNGENDKALGLYLKEGFRKIQSVVCYKYDLKK